MKEKWKKKERKVIAQFRKLSWRYKTERKRKEKGKKSDSSVKWKKNNGVLFFMWNFSTRTSWTSWTINPA